ncbi:MAG: MSMEG_0567/Sll0786 family nitrogen starvation N-acetyltransferase [Actinomycetota bacterium]
MVPPVAISPFSRSAEALPSHGNGLPLTCRIISGPEELAIHMQIREQIFVTEQKFFEGSERDEHDDDPSTIHVLGLHGSVAGGAVRLYPLEEPGRWKGDRLAVLPDFRKLMGAKLVRFAVQTAGERGGDLMIAHVQPQNVVFFRYLGWHPEGDLVEFHGHPHQMMAIPLPRPRPVTA